MPLTLVVIGPFIVGLTALLFGVIVGTRKLLKKKPFSKRVLAALLIVLPIVSYGIIFGVFYLKDTHESRQQSIQAAQQLEFTAYKPTYIPDGFKLLRSYASYSEYDSNSGSVHFSYQRGNEYLYITELSVSMVTVRQPDEGRCFLRGISGSSNYYEGHCTTQQSDRFTMYIFEEGPLDGMSAVYAFDKIKETLVQIDYPSEVTFSEIEQVIYGLNQTNATEINYTGY